MKIYFGFIARDWIIWDKQTIIFIDTNVDYGTRLESSLMM